MTKNVSWHVVDGFGDEWTRFDQSALPENDREDLFRLYFGLFPWDKVGQDAVGFDLGCGSGRWARLVAPRVRELHCIDASAAALEVAKRNLAEMDNCRFHLASVDEIPLEEGSADFGYSLGVLHHVPDTRAALTACVSKLKPGAPFLVYLYYAFDNRPDWFRLVWRLSECGRVIVSRAPFPIRYCCSQMIAAFLYWPLARFARLLEKIGGRVDLLPLSAYRRRSFYVMRTDALDRFGTRLEHRFTRSKITDLMENAGLTNIVFSDQEPFWCAIGTKAMPRSGPT